MENTMNTQGTDGDSVTVELPDWDATRRELIATRVAHGATSAIGSRCSNIVELLGNYQACPPGTDRLRLRNLVGQQMADLHRLLQAVQ